MSVYFLAHAGGRIVAQVCPNTKQLETIEAAGAPEFRELPLLYDDEVTWERVDIADHPCREDRFPISFGWHT